MQQIMKAARLHGIRDIRVEQLQCCPVGCGEILVRVYACSVCGSDVRIFNFGNERVKYPSVIGHEIAGEVVSIGENVEGFKPTDRVAVGADVPSMKDDWSKSGIGNLSDINYAIGYQFPGGFAQYCLLNELTVRFGPVTRMPEHVSYDYASLAEPLACCINGLERAFFRPGKTVLVVGAGPVGILLARAAEAFGAGLMVLVDRDGRRVEQAKDLGLKNTFDSSEISLEELAIRLLGDRDGFDIVLTACSSPTAQEEAVKVVAKRGVVNFFGGLPADARQIVLNSNNIHYKEAYITGSHGSTPLQHKLAVSMIATGRIDVTSLISHRLPLDKIREAFDIVERRAGLKVTINPWD
jgi:L-iditol 2-dehydrogenase